ncbi:MAG: tripartite tricarboxylate transporter substrate binding protein [Betaproteobacteria bacterium]|nr:tripartite tricarboxylate transporter substrate binding protein [Betaproteobacteria bacterium]
MRIKYIGTALVVGSLFLLGAGAARAAPPPQQYPTKPIRIVAPFPPGGTADFLARVLAEKLTQTWGQQVVVDNRSGAGGVIGSDIVAKATRDGYTLLMSAIGHAANPTLYKKLPYDTLRDFAPVVLIADVPLIVVVNPRLNVNSVKELIALARAKPGQLNFAAGGVGASSHWAGELFRSAAKIEWNTVQYKGGGPALLAVLGGESHLMFSPMPSSISLVKTGRLKGISITSPKRVSQTPDIPTIAEAGLPNYEFQGWYGLLAPAGVPQPILAKLNRDFNAALEDPSARSAMTARGAEPLGGSMKEFSEFLRREVKKYAAVAKEAGIRAQ